MKYFSVMKKLIWGIVLGALLSGCVGSVDSVRGVYYTQLGESDYSQGDYSDALADFQEAARLNNPYACYRLYVMYQYGQGTTKSPDEATRMLEKAAGLGDETSQVILGSRLIFDKKTERARGVRLLEAAARKENRYAYEYLFLAYQQGLGVDRDLKRAGDYQRLAEAQGSSFAGFKSSRSGRVDNPVAKSGKAEMTKSIQRELKDRGYYTGKVDGISGPMTRDAIARFQKDHGYPVNTEVSEEVLAKIREN